MIATVVFIIAFVVIALAVFFVAMSGGRGSHGKQAESAAEKPGKGGHRAVTGGLIAVIVVVGLAVPAQVGGDDPGGVGEGQELVAPLAGLAAKAVDEDHRARGRLRRDVDDTQAQAGADLRVTAIEFDVDLHGGPRVAGNGDLARRLGVIRFGQVGKARSGESPS